MALSKQMDLSAQVHPGANEFGESMGPWTMLLEGANGEPLKPDVEGLRLGLPPRPCCLDGG